MINSRATFYALLSFTSISFLLNSGGKGGLTIVYAPESPIRATSSADCTTTPATDAPVNHNKKFNSKIQFVFVVGLEGTGHHLMHNFAKGSPDIQTMEHDWQLMPALDKVHRALFHHYDPKDSLFNAHCAGPRGEGENMTTADDRTNVAATEANVTKWLMDMEQTAQKHNDTSRTRQFNLPLNTHNPIAEERWKKYRVKDGYGQVSYPNFAGECRQLNIPSLDLLYRACDKAQVDCGHVYIYRSPAAILKSTITNRGFHKVLLPAMHMYKLHLKIIEAELMTFPDRTLGCYGLLEPSSVDNSPFAPYPNWWGDVADLYGYESVEAFTAHMNSEPKMKYKKPNVVNNSIVPAHEEPYLHAFEQDHLRAIRLCEKSKAGLIEPIRR